MIIVATPLISKCNVQFTYFNCSHGPEAKLTEGMIVEIWNVSFRVETSEEITAVAAKITNTVVREMNVHTVIWAVL